MPPLHAIDAPRPALLQTFYGAIHVAGWFFDGEGRAALKIRVRAGRDTIDCQPVERADVLAHFSKERNVDISCGFVAEVSVRRGLKRLLIEAITRDHKTIRLGTRLVFSAHHHKAPQLPPEYPGIEKVFGLLRPDRPPGSFFDDLRPAARHPVVVIVPVYRDTATTRLCLELAMPEIVGHDARRLIAVNDASPDCDMQPMLEELAKRWPDRLTVLKNEKNLGFVQTVNRGLKAAGGTDVVLLNSDAHVANDWLSRLQQTAWSRPDTGTVTPLSNNAALASFPNTAGDNQLFLGLRENEIDRVFSSPRHPDVEAPTGVGYCLYIRADCIAKVGLLDHKSFGRGYGEENDFCQRAIRCGFKNLITPNVYVRHLGSVSFGGEKAALMAKARKKLRRLHPGYYPAVNRFMSADPLCLSRLCRMCEVIGQLQRPVIVAISHSLGGGTQQHVEELAAHLKSRAHVVLIRPGRARDTAVLFPALLETGDGIALTLPKDWDLLLALLQAMRAALVHFHHTLGVPRQLQDLPRALGLPHVATVHDYHWIGANPTLANDRHFYEGDPLKAPMGTPDFPLSEHTAEAWRDAHRPLLETAREVIFPTRSTREIFGGLYRFTSTRIVPHPEDARTAEPHPPKPMGPVVNIGILGALNEPKGARVVEALALLSLQENLPWKYTLIGRPSLNLRLRHVVITGSYKPAQLPALIDAHAVDVFLFPALCPETYSYTLSYALASHRPIMASRIGCFPERLANAGVPRLLFDINLPTSELLARIKHFIHTLQAPSSNTTPAMNAPLAGNTYYTKEYLDLCTRGPADGNVGQPPAQSHH